jgi:hypothetical protein
MHASVLTNMLTLLFFPLCFSKRIDRLSEYGLVNEDSTVFCAVVDAQMKMIAVLDRFLQGKKLPEILLLDLLW